MRLVLLLLAGCLGPLMACTDPGDKSLRQAPSAPTEAAGGQPAATVADEPEARSARSALASVACDVGGTLSQMGSIPPGLTFERPVPWVNQDRGWLVSEDLVTNVPVDAVLGVQRDGGGLLRTKFPWWQRDSGKVVAFTEPVAGGEAIAADLPDGYGGGFQPSGLYFSSSGCWRVKAGIDSTKSLSFLVYACESQGWSPTDQERAACGAPSGTG